MDAVTSFELEAQRRRETIAADRGTTGWRAEASTERVESAIEQALVVRRATPVASRGDCPPLARTTVG